MLGSEPRGKIANNLIAGSLIVALGLLTLIAIVLATLSTGGSKSAVEQPSGGAHRSEFGNCQPPSETIRENDEIRVFSLSSDVDQSAAGDVIVCLRKSGEWNFFFTGEWDPYPERLKMNGKFLVAEVDWGCADLCESPPISYTLLNAGTGDDHPLEESGVGTSQTFTIGDAVLNDAGVIVYSVVRHGPGGESGSDNRPTGTQIVRFSAKSGKREVLDSGSEIDVRSLRSRGGSVTWTNAGSLRTAKL